MTPRRPVWSLFLPPTSPVRLLQKAQSNHHETLLEFLPCPAACERVCVQNLKSRLSLTLTCRESATAHPPVCPACQYTFTQWIAPPCVPPQCTGPSLPVDTGCQLTVPGEPPVTTTTTIPGLNPGCLNTPTITSYFGCPSPPPCNQRTCVVLTVGGGVVTSCGQVPCAVVTVGTRTEEETATGLPLKCSPTSNTDVTTTTSTTPPVETGPQPTPPPFPTFDCDPFDPTC